MDISLPPEVAAALKAHIEARKAADVARLNALVVVWVWAGVATFRKRSDSAELIVFCIPFFLALVLLIGYLLTP